MPKTLDQMTLAELGDELLGVVTESRDILSKAETEGRTKETLLAAEQERIVALTSQIEPIKVMQKKKSEFLNRLTALDGVDLDAPNKPNTPNQLNRPDSKANQIFWEHQMNKLCPRLWNKTKTLGSDDYQRAFSGYLRNGHGGALMAGSDGMSVSADARGGYFVASEAFASELIKNVDDAVHIQAMSRVIMMPAGAQSYGIRVRRNKASSFRWAGENTDTSDTVDTSLSYGKRVMTPHYLDGSCVISKALVQSYPGAEGMIIGALQLNASEVLEQAYLTGDGNQKPLGLLTASDDGIPTSRDETSGAVANFTFDDFVHLKYSLKPKYRSTANWLMHRLMLERIALLKDGEGQYLWQPSRIVGSPDMILGLPFTESEWMPSSMTTGNYYTLLGNFQYYYVLWEMAMEIQRLQELRARTHEFEYLFRCKVDAAPVLAEAFSRGKLG